MRIFLLLTVAGITAIFFLTGSRETWQAVVNFKFRYFLLASLLILVDLFSGAWRIYIFLRRVTPGTFGAAFKANLANIFLAAATPFQTGGGVAQLWVLNYYGVSYAAGLTVSILNFVATLTLLLLAASAVLTNLPGRLIDSHSLVLVLDISRFAFYFTFVVLVLFLVRPGIFGRFVKAVLGSLSRRLPHHAGRINRWRGRIMDFIEQYQGHLLHYWNHGKTVLFWNFVLTLILYLNKCVIAYVILLGLGIPADFFDVILLQMLIIFFLYFAPTPGASLIAETGMSAVMSLIVPAYALSVFTVMWRFFTTYFGVLLGSLVLLRILTHSAPIAAKS